MDSVIRQCVVCETDYVPVMPHQRYCSRTCNEKRKRRRLRSWREGIERTAERRPCAECGAPFAYHPKLRVTYCSHACRGMATARERAIGRSCVVPWRICPSCGESFVGRANRRYCEASCRAASYNKVARDRYVPLPRRTTNCVVCGAAITRDPRGAPTTCSDRCNRRLPCQADARRRRKARERGARIVRYKRADIYERDGWKCQLCGTAVQRNAAVPHPRSATIDHIVPLAAGGADTPVNVQLAHFLCNSLKGAGDGQLRWIA